jgi:hypothetical protein
VAWLSITTSTTKRNFWRKTMILDIKGTLVNAFIEPQFKEVSSGHLVTVQFSDLDALGKFKHHMQGDTRIDLTEKYFHFTGYTQRLNLTLSMSDKGSTIQDLLAPDTVTSALDAHKEIGFPQKFSSPRLSFFDSKTNPFEPRPQVNFGQIIKGGVNCRRAK